jgi:hypothetical protein
MLDYIQGHRTVPHGDKVVEILNFAVEVTQEAIRPHVPTHPHILTDPFTFSHHTLTLPRPSTTYYLYALLHLGASHCSTW